MIKIKTIIVQITASQTPTSAPHTHKRKTTKSNENSVEMCIFAEKKSI